MGFDPKDIKAVNFAVGDILFRENDKTYHFYIIQEGIVEVYKIADDDTPVILAEVTEGTSLGEFAMIDRLPRSATARAKTAVSAVEVSEVAYERLLNELPDWAMSMMRGLVERIRNANEIVRRAKHADPKTNHQIASAEYNSDPKISLKNDDDVPDLA